MWTNKKDKKSSTQEPTALPSYGSTVRANVAIAEIALISALYVALTILISPIAYGPIQFRISEAMIILVAVRPHLIVFVPVGCFFANLFSPYAGVWDLLFMPLVSTAAALPLFFFKKRYMLFSAWFYAVVTALGVGLMISVLSDINYFVVTPSVLASQLIIMTLAFFIEKGCLVFFDSQKSPKKK
jgi:uncharacterized membrane protein